MQYVVFLNSFVQNKVLNLTTIFTSHLSPLCCRTLVLCEPFVQFRQW